MNTKFFKRYLSLLQYPIVKLGHYSEPSTIIVGAQKAGTTGIFDTLILHPKIQGSLKKELHFFNKRDISKSDFSGYRSLFPLPIVSGNSKIIESTPAYLYDDYAPYHIKRFLPNVRILIVLRNPTERAFSSWIMHHHHFNHGIHKKHHDPRSFREAIDEEINRLEETNYQTDRKSYVKRGIYSFQVKRYLELFEKDKILIIESSDFLKNFEDRIRKIQNFIGVEAVDLKMIKSNSSKIATKEDYYEDFRFLNQFYKPYNQELYELLGDNFSW